MEMSPINYYPRSDGSFSSKKKTIGLTLIEVLIALAIVSIALTAVIKSASESIRATNYLQNKTIAMWVASQVLNEIRVGLLTLPNGEEMLKDTSMTLSKKWYWQARQEATSNKRIQKITVQVSTSSEEEVPSLIRLESYIYREA